jgi:serine protease AprX
VARRISEMYGLTAAIAVATLALTLNASAGLQAAPQATVIVIGPGAAHAAAKHGTVLARLSVVGGVSASVRSEELAALAAERGVTRIAPSVRMVRTGNSPARLATVYPQVSNADGAWAKGYTGKGVGIAIIDSGVTPGADFGSRLVQVRLPDQPGSLADAEGHGTLVAGIAAGSSPDGRFVGIAPEANVYAINVSRGTSVYSSDVVTALNWVFENAHANNIRVVNLSVSETEPSSYKQNILDLAVERLWASGVVVVAAAGNTGDVASAVDYAPANDPFVITVGGLDDHGTAKPGDDTVATFSSRGTTVDGAVKPELLASGRLVASILTPGSFLDSQAPTANRVAPGYATISGTSFAAPQVAGAAAIVLQLHPDWSPDAVKYALVSQSRSLKEGALTSLFLGSVVNLKAPTGLANQGLSSLVCLPGASCLTESSGSTIASTWDSSSWTSSSWTSSSWTSSSWTSSSWTSSSWTSSSWTSSSWTSSSWTSSSWTGPISWSHWSWN